MALLGDSSECGCGADFAGGGGLCDGHLLLGEPPRSGHAALCMGGGELHHLDLRVDLALP
eukprot:CAMPEP_0115715284 /NCGR_PEP_ID=MMETSP0272-20121206/75704_1 /TAXON_ID=71861 /ORGANISM="Scrippsiella trochoidea, Strain CCMP3099" /LENGTH=59 /DNA_ID=CAMNT_0003157513 /DNA_START=12 /DNA_END=187 /DNA_ORIENTATION=-